MSDLLLVSVLGLGLMIGGLAGFFAGVKFVLWLKKGKVN